MRKIVGRATAISEPIIGRVAFGPVSLWKRRDTVLVANSRRPHSSIGYAAVLTPSTDRPGYLSAATPCVSGIPMQVLATIGEGDIVRVEPSGVVQQVWIAGSRHNAVMVSYACNCRCIMCPQPSECDPHDLRASNLRVLSLVERDSVTAIGLTGGEPTLRIDDLAAILAFCKRRFPHASISLLTNGRACRDREVVRHLAAVGHQDLLFGIALHADVASIHDQMMGVQGSFDDTVRGLHNLARARQRVELRVVLTRLNYQRLPGLAEFIYRNFPFAVHIAFMGLEVTGLARDHLDQVWIDPTAYVPHLARAVHHLRQRDLCVSLYNLPMCLLPQELRVFARDSISDWKKAYLTACESCSMRAQCSGVFSTSTKISRQIQAME